jgi:hypothetical protein
VIEDCPMADVTNHGHGLASVWPPESGRGRLAFAVGFLWLVSTSVADSDPGGGKEGQITGTLRRIPRTWTLAAGHTTLQSRKSMIATDDGHGFWDGGHSFNNGQFG